MSSGLVFGRCCPIMHSITQKKLPINLGVLYGFDSFLEEVIRLVQAANVYLLVLSNELFNIFDILAHSAKMVAVLRVRVLKLQSICA